MLRGDKKLNDKTSISVTRIFAVLFGIIGLVSAFRFDRVYDAFLFLSSLSMTLLFVPMIAALMYNGRKTDVGGVASMVVGGLAWIFFQYVYPVVISGVTLDPVLIGLPLSFAAFLIGNQFGKDLTAEHKLKGV